MRNIGQALRGYGPPVIIGGPSIQYHEEGLGFSIGGFHPFRINDYKKVVKKVDANIFKASGLGLVPGMKQLHDKSVNTFERMDRSVSKDFMKAKKWSQKHRKELQIAAAIAAAAFGGYALLTMMPGAGAAAGAAAAEAGAAEAGAAGVAAAGAAEGAGAGIAAAGAAEGASAAATLGAGATATSSAAAALGTTTATTAAATTATTAAATGTTFGGIVSGVGTALKGVGTAMALLKLAGGKPQEQAAGPEVNIQQTPYYGPAGSYGGGGGGYSGGGGSLGPILGFGGGDDGSGAAYGPQGPVQAQGMTLPNWAIPAAVGAVLLYLITE